MPLIAAASCGVFDLSVLDLSSAMRQYRCRGLPTDIFILVAGMIFKSVILRHERSRA
jgi:hypothetical protein